jgi:hypothetical protein
MRAGLIFDDEHRPCRILHIECKKTGWFQRSVMGVRGFEKDGKVNPQHSV